MSFDFGAALDFTGGLIRNQHEKKEAKRNRSFQERMSSTSYQRAMKDMKAAGLNPILAGKMGGASTPGGSKANFGNPFEGAAQKLQTQKLTAATVDKAQADAATAKEISEQNALDTKFYKEFGMSPAQIRHTPINQIGSKAIDVIANPRPYAESWARSTASAVDSVQQNKELNKVLKNIEKKLPKNMQGDRNLRKLRNFLLELIK